MLSPDYEEFSDQFQWGLSHPLLHQGEQFALMASMLFLPLGFLAIAHVARWHAPRLAVWRPCSPSGGCGASAT